MHYIDEIKWMAMIKNEVKILKMTFIHEIKIKGIDEEWSGI